MKKLQKVATLLIAIAAATSLSGCYNKSELKKMIQAEYDRMRSLRKAGDFCFYLGAVKLPYNEVPQSENDTQWQTWNKEDLTKTLPLFFELGLLSREQINSEPVLYRYALTPEGEKYQYYHPVHYYDGDKLDKTAFCYGTRKVLKVTDVSEREVPDGNSGRTQIKVYVDFDYKVEGIPDWVKSPKLEELYEQFFDNDEDKVGMHQIYLIKRADGLYDEGRIREIMRRP
jgi:hypothetical protein